MSAFASAVRLQEFSNSSKKNPFLLSDSVRAAVAGVASAFRSQGKPDPTLDEQGKASILLQHQLRGYKNADPGTKHQQTLPLDVLDKLTSLESPHPLIVATQQLILQSFFFAMRSCEGFKVPRSEERRTLPLRRKDFKFLRNNKIVPHTSPFLHLADSVSVTFPYQKKDVKDDVVSQMNNRHPRLNPVVIAAGIVRRILAFSDNEETPIYKYQRQDGKIGDVESGGARHFLRSFIRDFIDYKALGIILEDVGMHSIRTSAAMAMFLAEVPVYIIMLLGRWSSDAFLLYIRKSVVEFSHDISTKMIQRRLFYSAPGINPMDPRTRGDNRSAATTQGFGAARQRAGGAEAPVFRRGDGSFAVWG
jgi:hypothetical protein